MSYIISVIQQKGGVGKTTIAVHLAHELAVLHPRRRVAVADADAQQSASKWVARGRGSGVDILTAHEVAAEGEGKRLKKELDAIEADIIVVDLPPAIASVSLRAALYAKLILVPVGASALDIEAGRAAVEVCEEAVGLDPKKKYLLVPSKVRSTTSAGRELRSVLKEWGPVAKTDIGLRVALADAATAGLGICDYAPESEAHQEIRALAREVSKVIMPKAKGGAHAAA